MYGQFGFIIIGILSGVIGWTYSARLTDAEMILNWLYVFADQKLPNWIAKPLVTCYKCVSGQIGLWSFFALSWSGKFDLFSLFELLVSITLSIATSLILNKHVGNGETQGN